MTKIVKFSVAAVSVLAGTGLAINISAFAFIVLIGLLYGLEFLGLLIQIFLLGSFVFLAYAKMNPSHSLALASVALGTLVVIFGVADFIRIVIRDGSFRAGYMVFHFILIFSALFILCDQFIRLVNARNEDNR